jgi:hypothetical protein
MQGAFEFLPIPAIGVGMPTKKVESLDRLSDYLVNYIFAEKAEQKHVRRVLPWLGLLILAVDRVAESGMSRRYIRQVGFEYRSRSFKVRYNHRAGPRGGIEIVEYFGTEEGDVAVVIKNLKQAQGVYKRLERKLDRFIDGE